MPYLNKEVILRESLVTLTIRLAIKASDKKGFTLASSVTGNQYFMFIQISSRANIMMILSFQFFLLLQ